MAFGTYLPYSKHLHIITSEPNVYLMNLEPRGALRKMDLEADPPPGGGATFGAAALRDLTWRHLLDPLACTECGRCMEFCPASYSGKTLSPKHLMEGLRDQIVAAETALVGRRRRPAGGERGVKRVERGLDRWACRRRGRALAGQAAGAGSPEPAPGRSRHPRGGGVAVHDLRLVRGGLPGADRARGHHRRDPAQPRPGGEPIPA